MQEDSSLTSSPIDTLSIAVANYNNQYNNMYDKQSLVATKLPTFTKNYIIHLKEAPKNYDFDLIHPLLNHYQDNHLKDASDCSDIQQPRLDLMYYYIGNFSQSMVCITTKFGKCSLTMLHKLWYLYSYIYKSVLSNTTTIIVPI